MVVLAAVTAAVGYYALRSVIASKDIVIAVNSQNLVYAVKLESATYEQSLGFRGFLTLPEDRFVREAERGRQAYADAFRHLEGTVYTEEGKRMLREINQAHTALTAAQDRIIAMKRANARPEALVQTMEQDAVPQRDSLARQVEAFIDREQSLLQQGEGESTARAASASTAVVTLGILAVLFAIATAFLLSRGLSRQIGSAVQHVQNSSAELQTTANQQASGAREASTAMNEVTTTMGELMVTSRQISEGFPAWGAAGRRPGSAFREGWRFPGEARRRRSRRSRGR